MPRNFLLEDPGTLSRLGLTSRPAVLRPSEPGLDGHPSGQCGVGASGSCGAHLASFLTSRPGFLRWWGGVGGGRCSSTQLASIQKRGGGDPALTCARPTWGWGAKGGVRRASTWIPGRLGLQSWASFPSLPPPQGTLGGAGPGTGEVGQIKASFPSGLFVLRFYEEGVGPSREGPLGSGCPVSLLHFWLARIADTPQDPTGWRSPLSKLGSWVESGSRCPFPRAPLPSPGPGPPPPRSLCWRRAGPPGVRPAIDRWMLCRLAGPAAAARGGV